MSAEPPQIVIRTTEERLAAEAAAIRVSEISTIGVTVLVVERTYRGTASLGKSWWFDDREAASAWVYRRVRELSNKGIEICFWGKSCLSADERIKRPLNRDRRYAVEHLLKW